MLLVSASLQDEFGSYPSDDYGSDVYAPDDADVIVPDEHYALEHEPAEVLHT